MTGGHIGASLGVVELSIALLYEFDSPGDKIVWDVGHQAYAWKLLTGRNDAVPDAAPAGRHLRLPQAHRERARPVRRRPRRHRDVGRARHGHRARPQGRGPQGRRRRGRRRAHLRPLLRGDEQRRALRPRHHPDRQRQRDVDLAQRRRDQQDARPHRGRPAHQPAAREDQGADLRAGRRLRRGRGGLRQERGGERQEPVLARACCSRSSASATSARSTATTSPSCATRSGSCAA